MTIERHTYLVEAKVEGLNEFYKISNALNKLNNAAEKTARSGMSKAIGKNVAEAVSSFGAIQKPLANLKNLVNKSISTGLISPTAVRNTQSSASALAEAMESIGQIDIANSLRSGSDELGVMAQTFEDRLARLISPEELGQFTTGLEQFRDDVRAIELPDAINSQFDGLFENVPEDIGQASKKIHQLQNFLESIPSQIAAEGDLSLG